MSELNLTHHRFPSVRERLTEVDRRISICADLTVLLGMSASDRTQLTRRRESCIRSERARECAERRARDMGQLAACLAETLPGPTRKDEPRMRASDATTALWMDFVVGKTADFGALSRAVTTLKADLEAEGDRLRPVEHDSGSSSYSDYSASSSEESEYEANSDDDEYSMAESEEED